MLDFMMVATRTRKGLIEVYPKFIIKESSDLMIRGGDFYAIWIEERKLWSTNEGDAIRLIDHELDEFEKENRGALGENHRVLHMWDAESGMIDIWHKYCQSQLRDSFHPLDDMLIFSNTAVTKEMYASKRLPYPLEPTPTPAYEEIMSTLYDPDDRTKLEWAIGSIVNGDSKVIQKFIVLYGEPGSGKSTVLNIIQQLFEGYYSIFDSKALTSASNAFALEAFRSNPLVAIEHDGDLSRIEDNTKLNSLVSHEQMMINEKFKSAYVNRFKSFLFMGTNKPVRITDSKSGIIRRLIDVEPSRRKIPSDRYYTLIGKIKFELGGIALHCKEVYESDKHKYDNYIPTRMLNATNDFYNFMLDSYYMFKNDDGVSLKVAWEMYKTHCESAGLQYTMNKRVFKEELRTYFKKYDERLTKEDGTRIRSYYSGFKTEKFADPELKDEPEEPKVQKSEFPEWLNLTVQHSVLDDICQNCPAQYANKEGTPYKAWEKVTTTLKDLDTSKLHYVKVPENHIVIDFDIPAKDGSKDLEANLRAASKWPATYAELSKSGAGVHLHYIYKGDVNSLSRIYEQHIEVKVFTGKSSLRRMVTKCNNLDISSLSSGLPLKGEKAVKSIKEIKSETALRAMIERNLRKEYHPYTKPSIDFIEKILNDAYNSSLSYDVSDMRNVIAAFAASSSHNAEYCVKKVGIMHFKSKDREDDGPITSNAPIIFFDCEVFPNLFVVCWKFQGKEKKVVKMINPTSSDIETLLKYRLVGFNNRKYDNHMLYARLIGFNNQELYGLSQNIINNKQGFFGEAYNLSYTDIYDFSAKKQSLKKFEIDLGIHHQELGIPWDQNVPEDRWDEVAGYCENDVEATEATWNDRQGDFVAREILADIANMTVNDTTNTLTTRIIFGKNKHPQLVYTDLSTGMSTDGTYNPKNKFDGYEFRRLNRPGEKDDGRMHNMYRGVDLGLGGYVYAEPGMYAEVGLMDVASLHPNSLIQLNFFGDYTKNFKDILDTRILVKHKEYDKAKQLFGGRLAKYLDDPKQAKALAQALKIAINSVYGLTSASFDNPFRDARNVNNIVALRGALFMKTLQDEVMARGFKVAHIKTDSIKIPGATPEIINFCMDFAKSYGYTFEHEATYAKMCLVNNAVYIARFATSDWCQARYGYVPGDNAEESGKWTATGTQFAVPYVFKTLFSKEPIVFDDMCETKSVQKGAIYLDKNERLPESEHNYIFVGRVGQFTPVSNGFGGGDLLCKRDNDDGTSKFVSVTGTSGFKWLESEMIRVLYPNVPEKVVDLDYYTKLVDDAVESISSYGDFEWFVSDDISVAPWGSPGPPWELDSTTSQIGA